MARNDTPRSSATSVPKSSEGTEADATRPEVLDKAFRVLQPYLKDEKQASNAALQVVSAVRTHVGPLPLPEILDEYDRVLPGAAQEIMNMALREQQHRHSMENSQRVYPFLGLGSGLIAFLSCVAGAIYLALSGQPVVAGLLVGAPLIGAIGWFVNSRLQVRQAAALPAQAAQRSAPGAGG